MEGAVEVKSVYIIELLDFFPLLRDILYLINKTSGRSMLLEIRAHLRKLLCTGVAQRDLLPPRAPKYAKRMCSAHHPSGEVQVLLADAGVGQVHDSVPLGCFSWWRP